MQNVSSDPVWSPQQHGVGGGAPDAKAEPGSAGAAPVAPTPNAAPKSTWRPENVSMPKRSKTMPDGLTLASAGAIDVPDNDYRRDPAYHQFYYAQRPRDHRLPLPVFPARTTTSYADSVSFQAMAMVGGAGGATSATATGGVLFAQPAMPMLVTLQGIPTSSNGSSHHSTPQNRSPRSQASPVISGLQGPMVRDATADFLPKNLLQSPSQQGLQMPAPVMAQRGSLPLPIGAASQSPMSTQPPSPSHGHLQQLGALNTSIGSDPGATSISSLTSSPQQQQQQQQQQQLQLQQPAPAAFAVFQQQQPQYVIIDAAQFQALQQQASSPNAGGAVSTHPQAFLQGHQHQPYQQLQLLPQQHRPLAGHHQQQQQQPPFQPPQQQAAFGGYGGGRGGQQGGVGFANRGGAGMRGGFAARGGGPNRQFGNTGHVGIPQPPVGVDGPVGPPRVLSDLLIAFHESPHSSQWLSLDAIAGHIAEFAADQDGSRLVQRLLEGGAAATTVLAECKEALPTLISDVFGNYVVQRLFEVGTPEVHNDLAQAIRGRVLAMSMQTYGCRVVQKGLDFLGPAEQLAVAMELDGHVVECVRDQNGNHVVQKCIEVLPTKVQFIINAFRGQIPALAAHAYGCRVLQRIFERCPNDDEALDGLVQETLQYLERLVIDQYGNYVIQHILINGASAWQRAVIQRLTPSIASLSREKFSSNVSEKIFVFCTDAERDSLIDVVCAPQDERGRCSLVDMMQDQFANYVVQKLLDLSSPRQKERLVSHVKPFVAEIRRFTYGKHIIARIEKMGLLPPSAVPGGPPWPTGAANPHQQYHQPPLQQQQQYHQHHHHQQQPHPALNQQQHQHQQQQQQQQASPYGAMRQQQQQAPPQQWALVPSAAPAPMGHHGFQQAAVPLQQQPAPPPTQQPFTAYTQTFQQTQPPQQQQQAGFMQMGGWGAPSSIGSGATSAPAYGHQQQQY